MRSIQKYFPVRISDALQVIHITIYHHDVSRVVEHLSILSALGIYRTFWKELNHKSGCLNTTASCMFHGDAKKECFHVLFFRPPAIHKNSRYLNEKIWALFSPPPITFIKSAQRAENIAVLSGRSKIQLRSNARWSYNLYSIQISKSRMLAPASSWAWILRPGKMMEGLNLKIENFQALKSRLCSKWQTQRIKYFAARTVHHFSLSIFAPILNDL